jgi:tRNA A-37 threonylcarbamoyl transferase component Bud32
VLACVHGRARWWIEHDWTERLIGPKAPNWFKLSGDPRATRQKAGHRRGIWKVELGDRVVYAKVSRLPKHSLRERLRLSLRITPAEREWRVARAARQRGAPVVHFVGLAVRGGGRPGTILLSEAVPKSRTLAAAWAATGRMTASDRRAARLTLIDEVASMYAQAHRSGLVHADNHPQNILVAQEAILVDLPGGLLRSRAARHRDRVRTLAQLEHHFRRIASRSERLRFAKTYLDALGHGHRSQVRRFLGQIAESRADHAVHLARIRDRRLRGDGKYFGRIRAGGDLAYRATVVLKLERRHVFPEPGVPDRTLDDWKSLLASVAARDSGTSAHPGPSMTEARGHDLSVVHYQAQSFWERLKWTLLGSPPAQFFRRCHQLRHRDITAPLPLAMMSGRTGWLIARAWLILPRGISQPSGSTL